MNVGAVIVTGGRSRRMGRAKEWLDYRGRPLLHHVVDAVGKACAPIVVSASPGQELPTLPPGVIRTDDPEGMRDRGPVVGLWQGLRKLAEQSVDAAYLGSCDSAGVSPKHVEFMIERLAVGAATGVVPRSRDGSTIHPLSACVQVGPAVLALEAMIARDDRRARALFTELSNVEFIDADELPDSRVLDTFNTPDEWRRLTGLP